MVHQFDNLFSGDWYCWHWFPSKDDSTEVVTKNRMTGHQMGHELILESQPDDAESYMLVRLSLDDELATGTWHETVTSSKSESKGTMYSGAGQLIISEDKNRMAGQWAGIGFDHKLQKPRIYTGHWELARVVNGKEPKSERISA